MEQRSVRRAVNRSEQREVRFQRGKRSDRRLDGLSVRDRWRCPQTSILTTSQRTNLLMPLHADSKLPAAKRRRTDAFIALKRNVAPLQLAADSRLPASGRLLSSGDPVRFPAAQSSCPTPTWASFTGCAVHTVGRLNKDKTEVDDICGNRLMIT